MSQLTFNLFDRAESLKVMDAIAAIHGVVHPSQQATPQTPAPQQPMQPVQQPMQPQMPAQQPMMPQQPQQPMQPQMPMQPQQGIDLSDAALQGLVQRIVQAGIPNVGVPQILQKLQDLGVQNVSSLPTEKRAEFRQAIVNLTGGTVQ